MTRLLLLPPYHQVTAADYNRLATRLNQLSAQLEALSQVAAAETPPQVTATPPLEVRRRPGGWHLSLASHEQAAVVELTANLSIGSSAAAKVLWLQAGQWTEAATAEVIVHDALGTFEGNAGDKALVRFDPQSGQWIVWQLQC